MRRKNNTINVSKIIFVVLVVSFFAIVIKLSLVSLQKETDGVDLTAFVENRNTEKETLRAKRGSIYSTDGEILAQTVNSYTVVAYLSPSRTTDEKRPNHVVNKEMTAAQLSSVLGMDKDYLLLLLNKKAYQVELGPNGRDISSIVKKQIEALDLPGIGFIESSKRYYPMGTFAPYIVGFASKNDDGTTTGKMGIESYYNDKLQGKDGYTIYQKDAYGYSMPNSVTITEPAKAGEDIYLTLDSNIQLYVENGVRELANNNNLEWMNLSIANAKTGAIVATSSDPTFNLNKLYIEDYLNPLTSYQYEPGSTMKIFSFLASMENGKYDGQKTYKSGTVAVDDAVIKDFNGVGWGTITFDYGFANSSNVAATYLALDMGREALYNYYTSLGFGKKTGISLPNEGAGSIDFTYRTELATAAFGQGITTTPIQTLQALTILCNQGIEIEPYIVEKIVDSETGETTYQHKRKELGRKASPENINKMLSLMHDVVFVGKTDAQYFTKSKVTIAGKTGTAQIAGPNGKYLTGKYDYIRSFAAVFPYEDPQYVLYFSVSKYQGQWKDIATMIINIVEEIAKYKNFADSAEKIDTSKIITMDNFINTETITSEDKLKKLNLIPVILGNGKYIINQYPTKGKTILASNRVFIITNDSLYKMPDITGWGYSDVIILCKLLNIEYKITGYGKVVSYSIPKDTEITKDMKLEIILE